VARAAEAKVLKMEAEMAELLQAVDAMEAMQAELDRLQRLLAHTQAAGQVSVAEYAVRRSSVEFRTGRENNSGIHWEN